MNKRSPIKRHPALQPLSREHHQGLLLCWKIREGFKRAIEPERIGKFVDWFWQQHLAIHFEAEETYLFPILGNDHKLVKKALAEHRRIKLLVETRTEPGKSLSLLEEELEKHIRFEERVLFMEIESAASEDQLAEIKALHTDLPACENWADEFWK